MSAEPITPTEFDRKSAAWLADHPDALLTQMQQHRETVRIQRDYIAKVEAENAQLRRDKRELDELLATHETVLKDCLCYRAKTVRLSTLLEDAQTEERRLVFKADPPEPDNDPADIEVFEDR